MADGPPNPRAGCDPYRRRDTAIAFYDLMFDKCRPHEAVERYVGDEYSQHNPHVDTGKDGFIAYFERMAREYPGKSVEDVRTVAEGDLGILHCRQSWPGSDDHAGIDIFRFDEADKIVEHWVVLQTLPETSANPNGMF